MDKRAVLRSLTPTLPLHRASGIENNVEEVVECRSVVARGVTIR
jgi:hypothetical protein